MKYALVAALLVVLGLTAPVSAASEPTQLSYAITDNRRIVTIYYANNPDSHMIASLDNVHAPADEGYFRQAHGFMPYSRTPGGIPIVADTKLYIPDEANMVAAAGDLIGGSTQFMTYDLNRNLYVTMAAATVAGVMGTYNSTAPLLTNGASSALQLTSAGELIIATGGKTYVVLNQGATGCNNLFAIPIRVVAIVNPGKVQANPFGLYDDAGGCGGQNLEGQATATGSTGPVLGQFQVIPMGVRTTTGLSVDWFTGVATAGSQPYIQVQ